MKKNHFKRLCLLVAGGLALNSQGQNPQLSNWAIPPNQVSFAGASPAVSALPTPGTGVAYQGVTISGASNSMNDASGNLLFFLAQDGGSNYLSVFDKNGHAIPDANGHTHLMVDYSWSTAAVTPTVTSGYASDSWAPEISIIPVPGHCSQYYIIAAFQSTHDLLGSISYRPVYAKLDMSLGTNGQIAVVSSTSNLTDMAFLTGVPSGAFLSYAPYQHYKFGVAATPYRGESGNQNHFLYLYSTSNSYPTPAFYKFTVDGSGISYVNVETPTAFPPAGPIAAYYSETEVVHLPSGNYRMARAIDDNGLYWCDLDYATGSIISGTENAPGLGSNHSLRGLEFSPDGNTLYYSYDGTTDKIGYVTGLSSGGTHTPADYSNQSIGFIEMGHDNKMYFSAEPGDHLVSRSGPNTPSSGSWNLTAVSLPAASSGSPVYSDLLPDQLDGQILYPNAPTISGNNFACSTAAETYTLSGAYNPSVYYTWTVSGGTPASYTTSSNTVAITWTDAGGTFTVSAGCGVPATFTVKPCCRYTGTLAPGQSLVYLNDYTATGGIVTYSGSYNVFMINGTYNVNGIVNFSNCQVYLAPNAQVNINTTAGLKITNGSVWQAGCPSMWNGIVANTGGLTVDASTIRDAKLALDSKAGSTFSITNSSLNANYRNILLESYGSTHTGSIKSSTISCLSGGVPANCLIIPYSGKRSYSGIEVTDVSQAYIGLDAAGQANTFNNMDYGVINTRSNLTIYNNNFTNITYTGPNIGRCIVSSNSIAPAAEKKIIIGGNTNIYQANTFSNSTFGLWGTYNQDMQVISNTFTNLGEAADMLYCNGADNELRFENNIVNDCSWGLHSTSIDGSKSVSAINNVVNATIVIPKPTCVAFSVERVTAAPTSVAPIVTIHTNTVNSVSTGVKITNLTSPNVSNNQIYSLSNLGTGVSVNGVLAAGCFSITAQSNTITGAGATYTDQVGISISSSTSNTVTSNSVETMGGGLFFGGTCSATETAKNHMKDNHDAFTISYGLIGYQLGLTGACRATENKWEGSFTTHLYSYYSNGTNSLHNFYGSPMSTTTLGGSMYPSPLVSSVYPTTGYSAIPTSVCSALSGYKMAVDPKLQGWIDIAKGETTYPVYNESAKWMEQYALYAALQSDEDLAANNDLSAFKQNMTGSNTDKIMKAGDLLSLGDERLTDAQAMVSSISANGLIESNLKEVLSAVITFRKGETLSGGQMTALRKIAAECPYEAGPGVYDARVLLSALGENIAPNSCETTPSGKAGMDNMTSSNSRGDMIIAPNPNNGAFVVSFTDDNPKDFYVYDLMGKVIFEKHGISGRNIHIDITAEAKGIYFIKTVSTSGTELKKIVNQ